MTSKRPPTVDKILEGNLPKKARLAFVLAGHNGSGKTTLWYERLVNKLQVPLINADRLTMSILPPDDLPPWARALRDHDKRWQTLSQRGVRAFMELVMDAGLPFAFETVFSYWKKKSDSSYSSKADEIIKMQREGYYVVLLFVGLASAELSELRVQTRKEKGGHSVPRAKLLTRFPRTQKAIGYAAPIANMTLMFDNSQTSEKAFSLVRAQKKSRVLFDIRDDAYAVDTELLAASSNWLNAVTGTWHHAARRSHQGLSKP